MVFLGAGAKGCFVAEELSLVLFWFLSAAGALCFRPNMQRELREVVFLVLLGGPPRLSVVPQFLAAC
ncbi:hypothetical protein U1Q18_001691, partial [Sarracenia purpurea var. burkii]